MNQNQFPLGLIYDECTQEMQRFIDTNRPRTLIISQDDALDRLRGVAELQHLWSGLRKVPIIKGLGRTWPPEKYHLPIGHFSVPCRIDWEPVFDERNQRLLFKAITVAEIVNDGYWGQRSDHPDSSARTVARSLAGQFPDVAVGFPRPAVTFYNWPHQVFEGKVYGFVDEYQKILEGLYEAADFIKSDLDRAANFFRQAG